MRNSQKLIVIIIFVISLAFNSFNVESNNDLVAHYPFDGNAMDESENENHGTINGATLTYDRFGIMGNAYSFDGVDDYISFAPIFFEQDHHSIAAWIYVRTLDPDPDNVIIENSDSSAMADYGIYALYESAVSNEFQIYYFLRSASGTSYKIIDDSKYNLNKWYHVVVTYDGSFANIYINGQLMLSDELSITLRQNATLLGIGDDAPGGDANFDGKIDEVRIYNRSLSTTEIQELYQQQINSCQVPFFSQVDDNWKDHPLRTSDNDNACSTYCGTIGNCGCTLTSAAMIFNTYGASTNPPQLSDCMGTSACRYAWAIGASCSQGKAQWVSISKFSWTTLDRQLDQNHRPVILGMHRKDTDNTHWVVVLSGQDGDPANYRIHDPAFKCGVSMSLSTRSKDYNFDYLGIYKGQAPCSSLTALTPACVSRGANPQPVITSTINLNAPSSNLTGINNSPTSIISGTVWLYTMTELTMTVEITAVSSVGNITEMLIWSDSISNTIWQTFTPFVWLPVSDIVYARFKDNLNNITNVYSDTVHPVGPPTAPIYDVFLPLIKR